jgi:selenium metabolism protein YedF
MQSESRGIGCGTHAGSAEQGQGSAGKGQSLLIIIGTDALGKDEAIGKVLVKGFFETMKAYKQLPHTMFFLNAGVKLTTVNQETAPILKEIEAMGVEIYSCGTCLKHYGLESELKVGHQGATNQVVEGLQDFDKVVWI